MRLLYSQKQHSHLSFGLILFSHTNSEVPAKQGVQVVRMIPGSLILPAFETILYFCTSIGNSLYFFPPQCYNLVTVHSVHSNVAKIHSRLPAAMEFWLVCLGILAYSCQNTSQDNDV